MLALELEGDRIERGPRAIPSHTRAETALNVHVLEGAVVERIVVSPVERGLHRDRKENLGRRDDLGAVEPGRGNTDDGVASSVDQNVVAQDPGVSSESRKPRAVAQDRDGVAARKNVVLGRENAPERRLDAQHLEVVSADEVAPHPLGESVVAHAQGRETVRNQPGERVAPVTVVLVVGVGERGKHLPALVVLERDEIFGRRHGKRLEERLVQEREHRGVGSDPEGERKEADGGEAGPLPERSKTEAHVLGERVQEREAPGLAALLHEPAGAAELTLRRPPRLVGSHSRSDVVLSLHLAMETHLLFEIALELVAAEVERKPSKKIHDTPLPLTGPIRRRMPSISRSKSAASFWSSLLPAAVSR